MKIDQNVIALKSAAAPEGTARARSVPAAAAAAQAAPATGAASRLQVAGGGEFDAVRVAQIREAITAGHYRVDAGRIADGLLASVRDLLGEPR